MSTVYMLDTNICSFIIRERPPVLLERLQSAVARQHRIVVSVVTYYEMLLGTIGRNASPRHAPLVEALVARLSSILSWDRMAAEEAILIRKELAAKGTPIGGNDTMIAGHAIAADCVLITNNTREFFRVGNLRVEDWTKAA
jgi:tRNA(fMet)-specific endonuclease VapC